jgi:hypothetical protein
MKSILLASIAALLAGAILLGPGRNFSGRPERAQTVQAGDTPVTITQPEDPCSEIPLEKGLCSHSEMDHEKELITKNIIVSLL